jgi:hypothetical protein
MLQCENFVLGEYSQQKKREGISIVLLKVKLPALNDPLCGVVFEGCKHVGLHQRQIDELQELVQEQNSKTELVIILDGYDELPPSTLFKNLWRTNNLEQFRRPDAVLALDNGGEEGSEGAPTLNATNEHEGHPKVIITCRSELLSTNPNYQQSFLPLESQNENKDELNEAVEYFEEIRLIPFTDKREDYQFQHAALMWRKEFQKKFPQLISSPLRRDVSFKAELLVQDLHTRGLPDAVQLAQIYLVSTLPSKSATTKDSGMHAKLLERATQWYHHLCPASNGSQANDDDNARAAIVALLAALTQIEFEGEASDSTELANFQRSLTSYDPTGPAMWTGTDFTREFAAIPELASLTDTPFMVEIVTAILQQLKQYERSHSEIKSELTVTLTEETAEVAWALLRKADRSGSTSMKAYLREIQEALDDSTPSTSEDEEGQREKNEAMKAQLKAVAVEITLKSRNALQLLPSRQRDGRRAHEEDSTGNSDSIEDSTLVQVTSLVLRELQSALKRPITSRATIYKIFMSMWIEREADKAATSRGAGFSIDSLRIEVEEYALRLAAYLTRKSKVMISQGQRSALFSVTKAKS